MPGKTLAIDINEDSITAVQVISGLRGHEIDACAHVVIEENGDLDHALKRALEAVDLKSDTCVMSIPARYATYRNLQMPFKDTRKIRKTLPYEIDSMLPFPIEEMIVDFAIIDRSDVADILAVSIRKTIISEYLAKLQSYGLDPEILDIRCLSLASWLLRYDETPDRGILLDIWERMGTMVLYLKNRIALIRSFTLDGGQVAFHPADARAAEEIESYLESFCKMVRDTMFAFGRQNHQDIHPEKIFFTGRGALLPNTGRLLSQFLDAPSEQVNLVEDRQIRMNGEVARVWNAPLMDGALSLALRESKRIQGFNFRRDEFEVKGKYLGIKKELRKGAIFIVVILAFLAADMGIDYYFMKKRYRDLDLEIKNVFVQTFPDVKKIVDPLAQMKVKIIQMKGSAASYPVIDGDRSALGLLKDISGRIPRSEDVRITHMTIDPDTVMMSGRTTTFNAVENIKNGLESSPLFDQVTISSANLDRKGEKVQFEIKLKRDLRGHRP
ncbi:MAG: pilus assembly protein PilM [Pseudomonadota bacterium]